MSSLLQNIQDAREVVEDDSPREVIPPINENTKLGENVCNDCKWH